MILKDTKLQNLPVEASDVPESVAGAVTVALNQPSEISHPLEERVLSLSTFSDTKSLGEFGGHLSYLRRQPFAGFFGNVEQACGRLLDGLAMDGTCFELVTDDPNHPHHNAFMHLFADIVRQCNPGALSENTFRTFSAKNSSDEEIG